VRLEAYANNPNLNQVTESYFGAPNGSLVKTPPNGNVPNDVPAGQNSLGLWKYFEDGITCLGENPISAIHTSQPVTNEIFHITEISAEWAYCTENTKVFFSFDSTEFPCFSFTVLDHCVLLVNLLVSPLSIADYSNHCFVNNLQDHFITECTESMYN
jgi:hypothetical protein